MHLNVALKCIKLAKTDEEIKYILARFASDAQWCKAIGNECTEYAANCEQKLEKHLLTSLNPSIE